MMHLKDHANEIREGIERSAVSISDTSPPHQTRSRTVLFREGVIKLGFFIRSKKAAAFRQWATDLVVQHLDQNNTDLRQVLQRLDGLDESIRGVRTELDDLKELVGTVLPSNKVEEARSLIREIKQAEGVDGRAVVGFVKKTLGISKPYEFAELDRVINVLRNRLGKGVFGTVPQQN